MVVELNILVRFWTGETNLCLESLLRKTLIIQLPKKALLGLGWNSLRRLSLYRIRGREVRLLSVGPTDTDYRSMQLFS